ncbi:MAG: tetratricopeptide repeat protein [Deltaproteobacteria bacterium]|nr:tetratricopeptide repeat protein [Deltaproteobacteria bacterium]
MDLRERFEQAVATQRAGDLAGAARRYEELLAIEPDHPSLLVNLGTVRLAEGKVAEATELLDRATRLAPEHVNAHCQLGLALSRQGKLAEANASFARALELDPRHLATLNNRALVLAPLRRFDDARAHYLRALEVSPRCVQAMQNLGAMLVDLGKPGEAERWLRRALELAPDDPPTLVNLASAMTKQGRATEALTALEKAIALRPDEAAWRSNLLLTLHYPEGPSRARLFAEHLAWARHHRADVLRTPTLRVTPRATEGRRVRVGYVSPDLRSHAVAFFLEPLLGAHDRGSFELHAYANVAVEDAVSARLRGAFDRWTNVFGVDDATLCAQIRADGIDVLVDLAGHTSGHRLLAFAAGPAPVQITYLGYPDTSGVAAIRYRITDRACDPPGSEEFHSEELLFVERGMHCYAPPTNAPQVAAPPLLERGYLTFGSFSNTSKITEHTLARWARVLRALPTATLRMTFPTLGDPDTANAFRSGLARLGVATERVSLRGGTFDHDAHLDGHREVDVVLDTFPYHGTTTTCEALWMGVPVLTRLGDRHVARVGASLLGQVGLSRFAVPHDDAFVARAVELDAPAGREELVRLRSELRATMRSSALCDAEGKARAIESLFRAALAKDP